MIWSIALLFGTAALAPVLHRVLKDRLGLVLAALPIALLIRFLGFLPLPLGESHTETIAWVPSLGIEFALRLDGLSGSFALLILGIGALVVLYAQGYLKGDPRLGRFYGYLFAFMGAMFGLVLADDLVVLFVFWELTSVCSYLLIGFNHEARASRDAALKALLVTGLGGLALLAGVILLGAMNADLGARGADVWRISGLGENDLRGHALYTGAMLLIFLGAFTKSAQFPFHFWLPSAMAAPTPVSAYLHSATMVKAGIYLLARLHPALGNTPLWYYVVTIAGATTMVVAAISAACQVDLKRILAFSTVSVLGMLVMLLGPGTEECIRAAVVLLFAHALYKASLFMVAGNVDHETGTRDVTGLGGLRRLMPITAIAGVLAALSNAGAPPFFGFIGKELLYTAKLDLDRFGHDLVLLSVVANILLVATALVVAVWPFFGPRKETPKVPHEAPWTMLVGPILLAGASLFIGLFAGPYYLNIGSEMASVIAGSEVRMDLRLWHGISPDTAAVLGLSALTLAVGFFVFLKLRKWLGRFAEAYRRAEERWTAAALYGYALVGLNRFAKAVTRTLQSGHLRRYLLWTVLVAVVVVGVPLFRGLPPPSPERVMPVGVHDIALMVLILGGAIAAAISRSRLGAVISLAATGLGISLFFALYSAPDLAITQFLVESLSVVVLVLVFAKLPPYSVHPGGVRRVRDAVIALAFGAVMTLLVLFAAFSGLQPDVAEYYARASLPEAQGRNIVNVILVDFRALDTMGETIVVAVAGIGVIVLLRAVRRARQEDPA